ncbi:MAG: GWxTD domain-containing protein [Bacteroidota bacterium]
MAQRVLCFFILISAVALFVTAQERIVREQTGPSPISIEQYTITGDSNVTFIPVRLRFDFFVFTRTTASPSASYAAEGEISIEILDSTGNSIARKIKQINLTAEDNSITALRTQFYQDLFTFRLPAGKYSISLSLMDKESKRRYTDEKKKFVTTGDPNFRSGLIPVLSASDKSFPLINLGGDVIFSRNYGFLFLSRKIYTSAVYTLNKLQPDEEEQESISVRQPLTIDSRNNSSVEAVMSGSQIDLNVTSRSGMNLHYLPFDGTQLRQGRYELTVTFPDSTNLTTTFSARWLDMPVSLSDLDAATEPIQFITSKDDYSDLRKGSRNTRIKKFDEFWKKKDPTPLTAYNEVMHEFYRRVDFAITAFRTLKEMNGAVTDRGKIYLLFGKPTTTERLLNPAGAPREIWRYVSLNKTFTFEDPGKQGNYKLAENK